MLDSETPDISQVNHRNKQWDRLIPIGVTGGRQQFVIQKMGSSACEIHKSAPRRKI